MWIQAFCCHSSLFVILALFSLFSSRILRAMAALRLLLLISCTAAFYAPAHGQEKPLPEARAIDSVSSNYTLPLSTNTAAAPLHVIDRYMTLIPSANSAFFTRKLSALDIIIGFTIVDKNFAADTNFAVVSSDISRPSFRTCSTRLVVFSSLSPVRYSACFRRSQRRCTCRGIAVCLVVGFMAAESECRVRRYERHIIHLLLRSIKQHPPLHRQLQHRSTSITIPCCAPHRALRHYSHFHQRMEPPRRFTVHFHILHSSR